MGLASFARTVAECEVAMGADERDELVEADSTYEEDPVEAASEEPEDDSSAGAHTLDELVIELPYIPDFLLEDMRFWFTPSLDAPKAAFHDLVGKAGENWGGYYITKKGVAFYRRGPEGDGPFRVRKEGLRLEILEPGKLFGPKPRVRLHAGSEPIPLLSLERHRPLNPWKPNYIQALNFIKKYEWKHDLPRKVVLAMYEIEECGQVAGSVSWRNAERILSEMKSPDVLAMLVDFFYNRPEDYELGSQLYLRRIGAYGDEGFEALDELARHPITRKRRAVARALGELRDRRGLETLLVLLDDEDFVVRDEALRALVTVGVDAKSDADGKVVAFLESEDVRHRVWAAATLYTGGDESRRKDLIQLVKEEPRPLSDLGELGQVIHRLGLYDAVPFLIKRFKSDDDEIAIDAAEALALVTGLELEYHVVDDPTLKGAAIKALNQWWEAHKRDRGAARRGE